jgi:hypothetical protein
MAFRVGDLYWKNQEGKAVKPDSLKQKSSACISEARQSPRELVKVRRNREIPDPKYEFPLDDSTK